MDRDTYPARGGRKSTHPTSRDRWGHGRNKAEAGGDPYLTGRGARGIYPTGRDRRGHELNRQRQMGTQQAETDGGCIQQVETDGDTYSTGRDRRGYNPTGTQHVTCTQQVNTGTHQVETETGTDKTGRWPQKDKAGQRDPRGRTETQT